MSEGIHVYTVYHNTSDYPGKYVVRRFVGEEPEVIPEAIEDTLEEARKAIPEGLVMLQPSQYDDPVIVETWI